MVFLVSPIVARATEHSICVSASRLNGKTVLSTERCGSTGPRPDVRQQQLRFCSGCGATNGADIRAQKPAQME